MLTIDATTPRALLVDFGGVLTTSVLDAFAACSAELGGDPALIARLLREDPASSHLLVEHESGRLDDAGFERGYALGAIADEIVVSGEVGVRKPSRRIYRIACERLGVAPEVCVLVDDVERNLLGAARLGIRGILHVHASRTRAALEELFPTSTGADAPWTSS